MYIYWANSIPIPLFHSKWFAFFCSRFSFYILLLLLFRLILIFPTVLIVLTKFASHFRSLSHFECLINWKPRLSAMSPLSLFILFYSILLVPFTVDLLVSYQNSATMKKRKIPLLLFSSEQNKKKLDQNRTEWMNRFCSFCHTKMESMWQMYIV